MRVDVDAALGLAMEGVEVGVLVACIDVVAQLVWGSGLGAFLGGVFSFGRFPCFLG